MTCLCAVAATPGTPKIVQITPCPTGMAVVWYAERGRLVEVQQSGDMRTWASVATNVATGALCAYIDTNKSNCRFYRLKVK